MRDEARARRVIQFIECLRHTKGEFHGQPFKLLPWQEKIICDVFGEVRDDNPDIRQYSTAYIEIPKKQGKELEINTPIPTPTGWSTMGDLAVGDKVIDEKGHPCRVVAKSEIDTEEIAYRITFRDGSAIVAGENHLWDCEYICGKPKAVVWTTAQIYAKQEHLLDKYGNTHDGNRSAIRIRVSEPWHLQDAELPLDPYTYGIWLGDGWSHEKRICCFSGDRYIITGHIPYKPYSVYKNGEGDSWVYWYHELKPVLVKHHTEKVIRPEYLRASERQRWELLAGLMDSDGHVSNYKGQAIFSSANKRLVDSVRELMWSLGIKNAVTDSPSVFHGELTGATIYTIRYTAYDDMPLSKLPRYLERRVPRKNDSRGHYHYIKSMEPLGNGIPMQCIQVDSASHCYLAGPSAVPTHNSELGAAIALNMLCNDDEWKAEVYSCASDRQQAGIVFDVAVDMVKQSPALMKRVKIIPSTKRMVYEPTGSIYQVLSSEVATKHGLNVSACIFDELHTQPTRALYDVMTQGSGDARRQPLWVFLTTAGTDRNSICWEVHQKALDILEGRKRDPRFYPVIYGLPDDADWTSEENWYKANPSLGYTIKIDKVRDAYRKALETPADENMFRQLRLNQWVKQSVRWMPMDKWDACGGVVREHELEGRMCYAGLDLSSTSDLTAFVLVFPPRDEDEQYIILPYFWLPEDSLQLRVRRDHVMYDKWEREGFIKTTEGNVVHYGFIEQFICSLAERFNIREIAYDRWNAQMMVQSLGDDGFTMVPFGQGFRDMSPPTKELMRLVLERKINHGGNPVLRWNMDNAFVRTDPAGNLKIDKQKSTEKVDGAVALVMALDRATKNMNAGGSVYDDREFLFV